MGIEASNNFSGQDLTCVRSEKVVFARLSFTIKEGEAMLLLGPNGSGKSSLLRLMAGLLRPYAGKLFWNAEEVEENIEEHRARICYAGHHDAIKPVLNVKENIEFWASLYDNQSNLPLALKDFNLERLKEVPGRMLSAGQKRRTNLARLTASQSRIWLLDEPTTALDKASIKALEAILQRHQEKGGMVILSTHSDINLISARELWLDKFSYKEGGLL